MRKNNKKGFTIVELVIVIAVIAILAAVLIPTFAGATKKATESKALQEAKNSYSEDLALLDGQASNYTNDQYFNYTEATTYESGKTYYTKSATKYVEATGITEFATGTTYYTKGASICTGSFSGDTYTYETDKYTCTYTNGTWDIVEK